MTNRNRVYYHACEMQAFSSPCSQKNESSLTNKTHPPPHISQTNSSPDPQGGTPECPSIMKKSSECGSGETEAWPITAGFQILGNFYRDLKYLSFSILRHMYRILLILQPLPLGFWREAALLPYSHLCVFPLQPRGSDAGQVDGLVVTGVQLHNNGISIQHLHHLWAGRQTCLNLCQCPRHQSTHAREQGPPQSGGNSEISSHWGRSNILHEAIILEKNYVTTASAQRPDYDLSKSLYHS